MAKIPFSIDYKPQIESGEYKVETFSGYPVTIYRWDFDDGTQTPIMGSYVFEDGKEYVGAWNDEGHFDLMSPNDLDLFIVTPEEELTDLEKAVGYALTDYQLLPRDKDGIANIHDIKEFTKKKAAELLVIAKEECKNQIENDYREIIHGAYEKGMENALKDLPRWGLSTGCFDNGWVNDGILYYKFHAIPLKTLEVLPGFKED